MWHNERIAQINNNQHNINVRDVNADIRFSVQSTSKLQSRIKVTKILNESEIKNRFDRSKFH